MKKLYLLLLSSLCFLSGSFAQTLIDPLTGGGFDVGNTFASNGWTVVNSSQNKWVIGSTTFKSSPNSAYISKDSIASPGLNDYDYDYDNSTVHISHFYQKVTIPSNVASATLSFFLKGNVEYDGSGNMLDGPQVYADLALTAPVADVLPGTAIQLFPTFTLNPNPFYVNETLNLSSLAGRTILLIFTWVNDGDGIGSGPPASVDAVTVKYCIKNTNHNVTGGGGYCIGGAGAPVGLDGSVTGINYQLYFNGITPVGSPVAGTTGSPINFGPQTGVGTYTVVGTTGECTYNMPNSVTVTQNPLPVPSAGSNSPICSGSTLNLTAGGGLSYTWTGPNSFTSANQSPSIVNVTIAASGTYTATVTDNNGCSATATTDVTITPGAAGGTVTSAAICSGDNGSLTLSGNINPPLRWEYSTDSTSVSWTPISNITNIQAFSGITVPTFYRAVLGNSCGNVYSTIATVAIHNYWTGATNTDWNTASNWSDGLVPSATLCPDVFIPLPVNNNLPVISAAVPAITNLHILAGATVTINATGTLTLGGTISEVNPNSIIARNGTLNLNGTTAQTIPANTFLNNDLNNLIISNTNASGVTLGGDVSIYNSLTYASSGTNVNTGGFLTLKSSKTQTAWIGDMTGHTINGDVTVERYIATGTASPDHPKSWQFLAIPTAGSNPGVNGQTIHQSWQENCGANLNCIPGGGYGTQITGTGSGFDVTTADPSMKTYNPAASTGYTGVSGTGIPVYNKKGYFVFVRGDRTVIGAFQTATETVLRTKGTLFTPATPPPSTFVNINSFESVGNPYASAIDMRNIGRTNDVTSSFIVWDPRLGSQNGFGAFQTLTLFGDGNYYATPGGTATYPGFPTPTNYIQSGQAFFAQTSTLGTLGGTVSFNESAKAGGSALFTTPNPVAQTPRLLNTSLFQVNANGSTTLMDGTLGMFNDNYSNTIDAMDARKMSNSAENLAIKTGGKLLAVESRHTITAQDTIFFNLTGVSARQYRFHFDAENLDLAVQGFLIDNYLKTRTPLNMTGITDVNFTVANVTGSNAANRFMIVFEPLKALPVTFTSIKAYRQDKNINVEWRVDNEVNMKQYEVEKSTDGNTFTSMAQQKPTANNEGSAVYVTADASPVTGFNYYRVKSTDINGKTSYTNVVKVLMGTIKQDISIYPNPITDGMIHLQFLNEPAGKYKIRLLNKLGQVMLQKQVTRADGNGTELIKWDYNLAHGMYQLEITRPDGSVKDINVMY